MYTNCKKILLQCYILIRDRILYREWFYEDNE